MKNNLRQLIVKCSEHQKDLLSLIENYKTNFGDELSFNRFVSSLKDEFLYSSKVINLIADGLQVLDSKDQIEQFELDDILRLYKLVWSTNKLNLDYFKDYILFKVNVLGQVEDIPEEINEYLKLIENEKKELRKILTSLN